jgi:hypothetical protein
VLSFTTPVHQHPSTRQIAQKHQQMKNAASIKLVFISYSIDSELFNKYRGEMLFLPSKSKEGYAFDAQVTA